MYYNIRNINKTMFFQVPFALVEQDRYRDLTNNDRMIYAILFRRTQLSSINAKFIDSEGNIFIFYTISEMAEYLKVSESTVKRSYKALEDSSLMQRIESPNNSSSFKKSFRIYLKYPKDGESVVTDQGSTEEGEPYDKEIGEADHYQDAIRFIEGREQIEEVKLTLRGGEIDLTNRSNLPSSNKEYSNKEGNKTKEKNLTASGTSQKTLIDLPSKQEPVKMNRSETALYKIAEARAGRVDWADVNDSNFTYYYIDVHNRLMKNDISFKDGRDVSMLKKGLIERFELDRSMIADVIDKLLKSYSVHPKNERGLLSLVAIENDYLPKGFIKSIVDEVRPVERKYAVNQFNRSSRSTSDDRTDNIF